MNEALNRFGFSESMTQRRVPGPYVPLQDEPNDAGGIRAERNTNTVLVPQIHVAWDFGSSLGVVLGVDFCTRIDEEDVHD